MQISAERRRRIEENLEKEITILKEQKTILKELKQRRLKEIEKFEKLIITGGTTRAKENSGQSQSTSVIRNRKTKILEDQHKTLEEH